VAVQPQIARKSSVDGIALLIGSASTVSNARIPMGSGVHH